MAGWLRRRLYFVVLSIVLLAGATIWLFYTADIHYSARINRNHTSSYGRFIGPNTTPTTIGEVRNGNSVYAHPISPLITLLQQDSFNASEFKRLLDQGIDLNPRDDQGHTALMLAISKQQNYAAQLLIQRGADVNAKDHTGRTALHILASWPPGDDEDTIIITKMLLDRGASPNILDKDGNTALLDAANTYHGYLVQLMLKHGGDPNPKTRWGVNLLMISAAHGFYDLVEQLLNRHIQDINQRDAEGKTALFSAVESGKPSLVAKMLDAGAAINIKDSEGNTSLMEAVKYQEADIILLLLKRGAHINARNKHGETAFAQARKLTRNSNDPIIKILKNAGAKE